MKKILGLGILLLSGSSFAAATNKVDCKFEAYDTNKQLKSDKSLSYEIVDGKGISTTVGPYKFEISSSGSAIKSEVSISGTSSSSTIVLLSDADSLAVGKSLFGVSHFVHTPTQSYASVKYGCKKSG